jgi:dTDP-4-dehydrorhamnose reductase
VLAAALGTPGGADGGLLVLGSTGLLGQAIVAEARARAWPCRGAARSGASHSVDVTDPVRLGALVRALAPAVVVNCAAVTSLDECERQPALAYAINARAPALLAELSIELGMRLVQVSSDHFFTGDGPARHDEDAGVRLLNEYARTKYAGETFALTSPTALVVRTNIVGLRGWPSRPTFAEWALESLESARPITVYGDFFTSSMHSRACARALLDLAAAGASGLLNVASSEVASKREFVQALALAGGIRAELRGGSVGDLAPRRAESLGLDVRRAEGLLGRPLPDLRETVLAVLEEHRAVGPAGAPCHTGHPTAPAVAVRPASEPCHTGGAPAAAVAGDHGLRGS